jgi:hypothetical protein
MYIYKIEKILILYFLCNFTMDPSNMTKELERNIDSINLLMAKQQKQIKELEQLATYYKNRNANLEADFIEMAATIEILEKEKAVQIKS